jgi:hypothetical protein
MAFGRLGRALKAFHTAFDTASTGRVFAIACALVGLLEMAKGESAHALMLWALSLLLIDNESKKRDRTPR